MATATTATAATPTLQPQPQPQPQAQPQLTTWTPENQKLLTDWADKAKSYRWLHHRSSSRYSHRSQILTILISILSYMSGGSVLSSNFEAAWFKYFIGYIAILSGILTNVNGLVGWKQLSEKHKITSTKFSSFERSISSMLSIHKEQRVDAIEFINIKRREMDDMISNAPNIPTSILKQYEKTQMKHELSHFWIAFYHIFCCNKALRDRLLADDFDEEEPQRPITRARATILTSRVVEQQQQQQRRPPPDVSVMRASPLRPAAGRLLSTNV